MDKIKVLVADDVKETRDVIQKILEMETETFDIVGEAENGEQVIEKIPLLRPDVVLMDINMPVINGLEATELIVDKYPDVLVIIMSVQAENEYLKRAMFAGAKEYIIKPLRIDSLIETIKSTYEKQQERLELQKNKPVATKNANIITYFSSKGGVGKSVLALNSGIILSAKNNQKTLIMDMDLLFGDIAVMVNQYNHKTITDLLDDGQYDSFGNMKPYLFSYNDNLDILFAPKDPTSAEYINKESVEKIVDICKQNYDIIVIDTGVNFSDVTLYLLDISDKILFTSTMDMSSLKNTKLGLSVMESLHYNNSKVKLVINEVTDKYGITEKDIEEVFKEEIYAKIPEDIKNVRLSLNHGNPCCTQKKLNKLKFTKSISAMCKELIK